MCINYHAIKQCEHITQQNNMQRLPIHIQHQFSSNQPQIAINQKDTLPNDLLFVRHVLHFPTASVSRQEVSQRWRLIARDNLCGRLDSLGGRATCEGQGLAAVWQRTYIFFITNASLDKQYWPRNLRHQTLSKLSALTPLRISTVTTDLALEVTAKIKVNTRCLLWTTKLSR